MSRECVHVCLQRFVGNSQEVGTVTAGRSQSFPQLWTIRGLLQHPGNDGAHVLPVLVPTELLFCKVVRQRRADLAEAPQRRLEGLRLTLGSGLGWKCSCEPLHPGFIPVGMIP